MTETGESVRILGKSFRNLGLIAVVNLNLFSKREMNRLNKTQIECLEQKAEQFLTNLCCQIQHKPHAIIPLG